MSKSSRYSLLVIVAAMACRSLSPAYSQATAPGNQGTSGNVPAPQTAPTQAGGQVFKGPPGEQPYSAQPGIQPSYQQQFNQAPQAGGQPVPAQPQQFIQSQSGQQLQIQQPGMQPGVQQAPPQSGLGKIIGDVKSYVKDMVHVDLRDASGNPNVKVKAPFVNVDVNNGQTNVKVNAPFVHVTKSGDIPVSVDAPFVHVNSPTQPQSQPPQ